MSEKAKPARRRGGTRPVAPARRRFSVDEYERMLEIGILHEDEHIELLAGEIFEMSPIGSRHAARLSSLATWLTVRLAGRALVRVQCPIRLPTGSAPEPDLALVRPRDDDYETAHPGPEDVLLVVEVADTSLAYDRDLKLPRYAEAGIPEAWILDLPGSAVLVGREPSGGSYQSMTTLRRGDLLSPAAFPDLRLPVDQLLR